MAVFGDVPPVLGGIVVAIAVVVGVKLVQRVRTRGQRSRVDALEARLADLMPTGRGTHLESPPQVRAVETTDDEPPAIIPVIRIDLETADRPGMELVFGYVVDVLEAIQPILEERDERVERYDLEFTFGPGGLLVDGECRRVSVPPAFAQRVATEEEYRAFELHRDVKAASEDESDEPNAKRATLWGPCRELA
ncbi:hypothetical protein G6M89_03045 [Natronolimnobius sp. AArcel1]|uniref:hypothetical protein n=1 Tax=Natronolimnobius sp. AArcel1 TaxID=1679093 RepID=UPI0013EA11B2|nr:hypothetical protein [Natronolimnobius sp. AArcel1]NGM68000.1 hypothetical protein [Natronolimnobius sp. AArcel1]